jgi:hypothetical protein
MTFIKTLLDTHIAPPHDPIHSNPIAKPIIGVFRKLKQQWQEHAKVINGNLEFGSPTAGPVNINGVWATVTTPVTPNTDFVITHNLGRVPVNHAPTTKTAPVDVYVSPTPNASPNTTIILRATTGSVPLTFFMY